jgi:hypothetical protein
MQMNIETKGYVATDKDIGDLTDDILDAGVALTNGNNWYLRALIATTQKELGAPTRVRTGRAAKLDPETKAAQLAALTVVHERFYAVVLERARKKLGKVPAKVLNGKVNFARTAVLTARNWIRAQRDLTAVSVTTLTKAAMMIKKPPKPPSTAVLKRRLEAQGKQLVKTALELIDIDKEAANTELELIMSQLATQLLSLGGKPTANAAQAASQHRPLRVKSTVFVPTETQVARQLRAPS